MDARDAVPNYDSALEARFFDDELEFDSRELEDAFDLDARNVDDYVQFDARGRFGRKVASEQQIMASEAAKIKAEQAKLKNQRQVVSLQEQIHNDKKTLRKDNFGNPLPARGNQRPDNRFNNKISSEQLIMEKEVARIRKQQLQLQTQSKDLALQEQIHKDRQMLKADAGAFSRRGYYEWL